MNWKKVLSGVALALASLATFFALCELSLQVVLPLFFRPRFTKLDAELGWYHNASVSYQEELEGHRYTLSYNSHGFRPPEHSYAKPPALTRVVVLGDSFVDASEVGDEETFAWRLQQCMTGVEVINLGVYGYSTAQELLLLERFGLSYQPDLVIVLTISNDYVGNVMALESFGPAPRFMPEGNDLRLEGLDHPSSRAAFRATNLPVPGFIHRNSIVYYLINRHIYQRLIARDIREVQQDRANDLDPASREELYRRLAVRMSQRARAAGADLVVAFGYLQGELMANVASPSAGVASALLAEGIGVADLFGGLRQAQMNGESIYYERDIHWNVAGQRVVANLLKEVTDTWTRDKMPSGIFVPSLDGAGCTTERER